MDILNFISWIASKRRVVKTLNKTDLIPLGVRTETRDDKYTTVAITASDFVAQLAGDRLIDGNAEVVLIEGANDAALTFSPGDAIIQTSGSGSDLFIRTLGGDDIILESGDDIRLQGDQGDYDAETEGGDINIYGGNGSDGGTANAGSGGDIRIEAGDAGNSVSGSQGEGGFVTIGAGYTTTSGLSGGDINLYPGNSVDGIHGDVIIQGNFTWTFYTRNGTLLFPAVTLATLPNAASVPGAKAMIADSNAPAPGNFGVIAATGGSAIVPVFSDGINWLIG
jgi:hypothetical protein